jgi:hypothetical protein
MPRTDGSSSHSNGSTCPVGDPGRMRPLQCLQDLHGKILAVAFRISDLVGPCSTRCTGGHWWPHMLQRFCWPILPCPL